MFTDRHVVAALLIAPLLALIAWFAVDYLVAERPEAARQGASYTLAARSGCRYASGRCDLENADLRLSIEPAGLSATAVTVALTASHRLQGALLGFADTAAAEPTPMQPADASGTRWQLALPLPESADTALRIAVVTQGATWYAEVPAVFLRLDSSP